MKVFITGAAGYIGGSIAEHLHNDGHAVHGLVRRDTQADGLAARDQGVRSVVLCNSMIYGAGRGLHADSAQIPPLVAQARRELGWVPSHASVTEWIERETPLP